MKTTTLVLALIFGVLIFSSSKNLPSDQKSPKTRLDSLMSKQWRGVGKDSRIIEIFSKKTRTREFTKEEEIDVARYVYYLTDSIPKLDSEGKNFDWSKVGKTTKGNYLITKLTENMGEKCDGEGRIYRIIELSDKKLELEWIKSNGERTYVQNLVYEAEPLDK